MAMKFIATLIMLAGLFGTVGCKTTDNFTDDMQVKRTNSAKPVEEEENFPAAVSKLLPADQLDARNAHAQSKLLNEHLEREKSQLGKTATAQRD
jgi:hypothetical protein